MSSFQIISLLTMSAAAIVYQFIVRRKKVRTSESSLIRQSRYLSGILALAIAIFLAFAAYKEQNYTAYSPAPIDKIPEISVPEKYIEIIEKNIQLGRDGYTYEVKGKPLHLLLLCSIRDWQGNFLFADQKLYKYNGENDFEIDISKLPNSPDCFDHIKLALSDGRFTYNNYFIPKNKRIFNRHWKAAEKRFQSSRYYQHADFTVTDCLYTKTLKDAWHHRLFNYFPYSQLNSSQTLHIALIPYKSGDKLVETDFEKLRKKRHSIYKSFSRSTVPLDGYYGKVSKADKAILSSHCGLYTLYVLLIIASFYALRWKILPISVAGVLIFIFLWRIDLAIINSKIKVISDSKQQIAKRCEAAIDLISTPIARKTAAKKAHKLAQNLSQSINSQSSKQKRDFESCVTYRYCKWTWLYLNDIRPSKYFSGSDENISVYKVKSILNRVLDKDYSAGSKSTSSQLFISHFGSIKHIKEDGIFYTDRKDLTVYHFENSSVDLLDQDNFPSALDLFHCLELLKSNWNSPEGQKLLAQNKTIHYFLLIPAFKHYLSQLKEPPYTMDIIKISVEKQMEIIKAFIQSNHSELDKNFIEENNVLLTNE